MASFPDIADLAPQHGRRAHASPAAKAKILARLRRLEGQARGVQRMVDEDASCLEVLTQLAAVISAARSTGLLVLEGHIRGCVFDSAQGDQEAALTELTDAIERFTKTVG